MAYRNSDREKTYTIWRGMKKRCLNPKDNQYKNYGGRGISVSVDWMSFESFVRDMGYVPKGKSIDRIDNNGNYCKENCRWATRKEQGRNTRTNRILEFDGKSMCIADWGDALGLKHNLIAKRLSHGWSVERALSKETFTFHRSRKITFNGHTLTTQEWADKLGIKNNTLAKRFSRGWSLEQAMKEITNDKP